MTLIQNYYEKKIENENQKVSGNENSPPQKNNHEAEENVYSPPT